MATIGATAIRQEVDALRRVVDEAVERLPASELTALHDHRPKMRQLKTARTAAAARFTGTSRGW